MTSFDYLIGKGHLARVKPDKALAEKEWKESELDLGEARKELRSGSSKWATVKAYYSIFHAAKAVLFLLGLKERSHYRVFAALEILSKEGKIESNYVSYFMAAMSAREGADYHYDYEEKTAKETVEIADNFVKRMKLFAAGLKA